MIRHIVMLSLRPDADEQELDAVMTGLGKLVDLLPGFVAFEHGPNRDFEGLSADYGYGCICTFEDVLALQGYAADQRHQALGARLVALCQQGTEGLMVIDLDLD